MYTQDRFSLKGLCHGSPVQFVVFCQLLVLNGYGLKVSKVRDPGQINMSPEHYFLKLQAAGISFEKLLG